jgi:hypothetical protein
MKKVLFVLLAGAAVSYLLNSEKGTKTLKKLSDSLDDIKDKAMNDMGELLSKGKKWIV